MYRTILSDNQKLKKALFILFALLILKEIIVAICIGQNPSPIGDKYSERNAINGAAYFLEHGISSNSGLPHFSGVEIVSLHQELIKDEAYTHYPPGPEYLIWLSQNVCGSRNIVCQRFLPITVNATLSLIFLITILTLFTAKKAILLAFALIAPPMFSYYMHGLHYQGYALSILLLQVALIWKYLFNNLRFRNLNLSLFFLSFLQGWLSFDYAFLATFCATPFLILEKRTLKEWLLISVWSGLGFTAAHLIHFYQVITYLGSFEAALADLLNAAKERALNTSNVIKPGIEKLTPLSNLKDYLWRVSGRGKYLAVNLINIIWLIILLHFVQKIQLKWRNLSFSINIERRDLVALLTSILVSGAWTMIMKQHAFIHGFIARHYYLIYLIACYVLIKGFQIQKEEA